MASRKPPILVTGAPRTGTTFLGTMLSLNPDVAYIYEPLSLAHGLRGLRGPIHYPVPGSSDETSLANAVDRLLAGRGQFRRGVAYPEDSRLRRTARGVFGSAPYRRYLREVINPRRRRWLLKDPWAVFSAEWLHRHYDMPTVVITRHPVPTVASYQRLDWDFEIAEIGAMGALVDEHLREVFAGVDIDALTLLERRALFWRICNVVLIDFLDRNPAMIAVRYEDLSADPVAVLRELYQRLDLRFDADVEHAITAQARTEQVYSDPETVATIRMWAGPEAERWYPAAEW